jgi:hypothetical protein
MIYILDENPQTCAKMLDDKSLDKMIKSIAQVLCNVHYHLIDKTGHCGCGAISPPLDCTISFIKGFAVWGAECLANYRYLTALGAVCCDEYTLRFTKDNDISAYSAMTKFKHHKHQSVVRWAIDNEPDLPEVENTDNPSVIRCMFMGAPPPLVMPEKYKFNFQKEKGWPHSLKDTGVVGNSTMPAYRNYYKTKLKDDAIWTRREKPEFLKENELDK